MLLPILHRRLPPILQILLKRREKHQLLAHDMPRHLPRQLVLVPRLLVVVLAGRDGLVVRLDDVVVVLDGFLDRLEVRRGRGVVHSAHGVADDAADEIGLEAAAVVEGLVGCCHLFLLFLFFSFLLPRSRAAV